MASFFSVHQSWADGWGGELVLGGSAASQRVLSPMPNTLYGMIFGPNSFHHVRALVQPATRSAIYQEWDFDDGG